MSGRDASETRDAERDEGGGKGRKEADGELSQLEQTAAEELEDRQMIMGYIQAIWGSLSSPSDLEAPSAFLFGVPSRRLFPLQLGRQPSLVRTASSER